MTGLDDLKDRSRECRERSRQLQRNADLARQRSIDLGRKMYNIPADTQAALDELLVVVKRDHMSADDVADRLEMVTYFYRDLLTKGACDWVVRIFSSALADVARERHDLDVSDKMLLAIARVETALREAAVELVEMRQRVHNLQYSLREGVPLAETLVPRPRLAAVGHLTDVLDAHNVRLARTEARVLLMQGVSQRDTCELLGVPSHVVKSFVSD